MPLLCDFAHTSLILWQDRGSSREARPPVTSDLPSEARADRHAAPALQLTSSPRGAALRLVVAAALALPATAIAAPSTDEPATRLARPRRIAHRRRGPDRRLRRRPQRRARGRRRPLQPGRGEGRLRNRHQHLRRRRDAHPRGPGHVRARGHPGDLPRGDRGARDGHRRRARQLGRALRAAVEADLRLHAHAGAGLGRRPARGWRRATGSACSAAPAPATARTCTSRSARAGILTASRSIPSPSCSAGLGTPATDAGIRWPGEPGQLRDSRHDRDPDHRAARAPQCGRRRSRRANCSLGCGASRPTTMPR